MTFCRSVLLWAVLAGLAAMPARIAEAGRPHYLILRGPAAYTAQAGPPVRHYVTAPAYAYGWFGVQRMTRQEALKGFTIWAAYAAFQEDILGSIEVGKLADMTVLSKDILTIEPKEILTTTCQYTITAGKIRYQKK